MKRQEIRSGKNWLVRYSKALESRKDDRDVHDLGFIFYHGTYRRWYEATQVPISH